MTEQRVTPTELFFLSFGVGLFGGLALLTSVRPGTEQREYSGHSNREEFLTPGAELRAPFSQKWYGLPGYRNTALPEGKGQEQRLY